MKVTVDAEIVITPENQESLDELFQILDERFADGETVTKESSSVKIVFTKQEQVS